MLTKRKFIWPTAATLAILATLLLARSPEQATLKYRPQLFDRPDESFKFLDSKVTRESELSFVCGGNFRCRVKLYFDRALSALRVRKALYRIGGTTDFLWITYRSKKLTPTS